MMLIRSHKLSGAIAGFLSVAMVVAILPWSAIPVSAAVDTPTKVLLFPAADNSGGDVADLAEMTTNRIYAALEGVVDIEVIEFERGSPLVRRALSEGRLLPVHMELGGSDVAGAIGVGYNLDADAILLATVNSVDVQMPPRRISIALSGRYYLVGPNYDEAAGQPVGDPQPDKAFTVSGTSRARANYTGSDRPLVREALENAVAKFAQVMGGTPVSQIGTGYAPPRKSSRWKWLGPVILLGLAGLLISKSGGGGEGISTAGEAPTALGIEVDENALRLSWVPPVTALDLQRYQIERSVNGGGWDGIDHGHCGPLRIDWPDYDVEAGNRYRYHIRAVYTNQLVSEWVDFNAVDFTGS